MDGSDMEDLLRQYNPHWDSPPTYELIPREPYLETILTLLDRREIIVLQGIRRSGKSSLLKLIVNELLERDIPAENILFMNLEDYRFGAERNLTTLDAMYQAYREIASPTGRTFILLDEIQEVPQFEKWLRTHYDQHPSLKFIITGSSSSLFSRELATLLTGRHISLEIFPFSFGEYLHYRDREVYQELRNRPVDSLYLSSIYEQVAPHLQRYLDQGGFPEVVKHDDPGANILLLQQYLTDIILRDVARRYNIRRMEVLQKLALYLIFNMSGMINVSRIAEQVGSNRTTVLDLIGYLKEVYLIFTSGSFSFSVNEQLTTTRPKRVYCVDNGFFAAIKTGAKDERSRKMKNVVYQHLRFRWREEPFYWSEKVTIDFVLPDGFPILVAPDGEAMEAEIDRLFYYLTRHNLPRGLLISQNKMQILEENERRIHILPLWLFLTRPREEVVEF
ncbi:MAG: ATP-binding protein [Calditrichaeota bacterium]|nr:MAG: ATP-binding protein [Calditrichota bacterium]